MEDWITQWTPEQITSSALQLGIPFVVVLGMVAGVVKHGWPSAEVLRMSVPFVVVMGLLLVIAKHGWPVSIVLQIAIPIVFVAAVLGVPLMRRRAVSS